MINISWDSVDSSKATEKQIKYAEALLEKLYGDINIPIYTMTKQEISKLIDKCKEKLNAVEETDFERQREECRTMAEAIRRR